jgi:Fanconi anemia group M protein
VKDQYEEIFSHPFIKDGRILRREYQVKIATKSLQRSTLVVLPTGLGKTVVALIHIAERLNQGKKPILMLAPTKPLVEQHRAFMSENLNYIDVVMLT